MIFRDLACNIENISEMKKPILAALAAIEGLAPKFNDPKYVEFIAHFKEYTDADF